MHAGPEIGVASTKAFATMIVAVYLLGLWLGRQRNAITAEDVKKRIHDLVEIPRLVEKTLELDGQISALARELAHARDFLYLGRGVQYPIALEGALKLKEISYIHAEGYAGGEMKHGPIALIDDGLPVVALAPRDGSYERMLGNIEEVRAREGQVIAVVQTGDRLVAAKAQHVSEAAPGPGCRITASTSGSSTTASTTTSTMASPGGPGRACLTGRSSTYSSSRSDGGDHHEPPLRLSGPDEVHQALGPDAQHVSGEHPGAQPAGRHDRACPGRHPEPAVRGWGGPRANRPAGPLPPPQSGPYPGSPGPPHVLAA